MLDSVKKYGVITAQQTKDAIAYRNVQANLTQSFNNLKYQIADILLPVFTKFSNSLLNIIQWFRNNKIIIESAIIGISSAITVYLLPALFRIGLAIIPLLPIVAVLTAIGVAVALIAQDVIVWLNGGNSAFGEYYQKIADIYDIVKKFIISHKEFIEGFLKLSAVLAGDVAIIYTVGKAFDFVKKGLQGLRVVALLFEASNPFGWVVLAVSSITALGIAIYKNKTEIEGWFSKYNNFWNNLENKAKSVGNSIATSLKNDFDPSLIISTQNQGITAQALANTVATNKQITNNSTTQQAQQTISIGAININTNSTNTKDIADATTKGIADAMQKRQSMIQTFNSGLKK